MIEKIKEEGAAVVSLSERQSIISTRMIVVIDVLIATHSHDVYRHPHRPSTILTTFSTPWPTSPPSSA